MREEHIIKLLDRRPLSDLRETELSAIEGHTANCPRCRQAFRAAQLSNLLLRSLAEPKIEPAPFFNTNLMTVIRGEQVQLVPFSFLWIWREANRLIYAMAASAVILSVLALWQLGTHTPNMRLSTMDPFELIVYGMDSTADELSYGQVLMDLYAPLNEKEGTERNRQEK